MKSKGDQENVGVFRSTEAKLIIEGAWSKIKKEMSKYEKNQPFFQVNDMFGNSKSKDLTGKFDI